MTMQWIPYILLFIALLAFFWRTAQVGRLSQELDIVRRELAQEGFVLQNAINTIIQDFVGTLYYYRPIIHDRAAMEALALHDLAEDLRMMSKFVGFGEATSWSGAFNILAECRVRLIVGRVALSASASDEFKEGMDKLVDTLKVFDARRDFRRSIIRWHAPSELSNQRWPDLQVAQLQVADTQEQARNLMKLLEQDQWRAVPQA